MLWMGIWAHHYVHCYTGEGAGGCQIFGNWVMLCPNFGNRVMLCPNDIIMS